MAAPNKFANRLDERIAGAAAASAAVTASTHPFASATETARYRMASSR
jgi:hypothetical protein